MAIKLNLQLSGEIELPNPLPVSLSSLPPIELKSEVLSALLNDISASLSPATLDQLKQVIFTDAFWTKLIDVLTTTTFKVTTLDVPTPAPIPTPVPPIPTPTPPSNNSSLLKPPFGAPSTDSLLIYVSSSTGNDSNNGLSETTPKKTIAAGYNLLRSGFPDRLFLKKGDAWTETLGTWKKCGRNPLEPMVISSYGQGPRPILKTGTNTGITCHGSSGTPTVMHSVTLSGLFFYANTRDPQSADFVTSSTATSPAGIRWLRGGNNLVVDDCMFKNYHTAIIIQDYENTGMQSMAVRGCVVVDSYSHSPNDGHSQGIFTSGVDGLLIEDCVFDMNGWNPLVSTAIATMYNHNMYLQYNCKNVVTRRNILMRASSHAVQQRSGGLMEHTFAWRNPIGLTMGSNQNPSLGTVLGTIKDSVVLEGTDITTSLPRGWGIQFEDTDLQAITIQNNVVANVAVNGVNRLSILDRPAGTYLANIVWNWPSVWGGVTKKFDSLGPFKDPNRSLNGYKGLLEPQVIEKIRGQSRDTFNEAFTAEALNAYVREGFVKP